MAHMSSWSRWRSTMRSVQWTSECSKQVQIFNLSSSEMCSVAQSSLRRLAIRPYTWGEDKTASPNIPKQRLEPQNRTWLYAVEKCCGAVRLTDLASKQMEGVASPRPVPGWRGTLSVGAATQFSAQTETHWQKQNWAVNPLSEYDSQYAVGGGGASNWQIPNDLNELQWSHQKGALTHCVYTSWMVPFRLQVGSLWIFKLWRKHHLHRTQSLY